MPGEAVTYLITITNWGPSRATDVQVAFWSWGDLGEPVTTTGSCTADQCLIPELRNRQQATVTVTSTFPRPGEFQVRAMVWGSQLDVEQSNNDARVVTRVLGPDLSVTSLSVAPRPVRVGDLFTITTAIENSGPVTSG